MGSAAVAHRPASRIPVSSYQLSGDPYTNEIHPNHRILFPGGSITQTHHNGPCLPDRASPPPPKDEKYLIDTSRTTALEQESSVFRPGSNVTSTLPSNRYESLPAARGLWPGETGTIPMTRSTPSRARPHGPIRDPQPYTPSRSTSAVIPPRPTTPCSCGNASPGTYRPSMAGDGGDQGGSTTNEMWRHYFRFTPRTPLKKRESGPIKKTPPLPPRPSSEYITPYPASLRYI